MIHHTLRRLGAIAVTVLLPACGSDGGTGPDDNGGGDGAGTPGRVTATINGADFIADGYTTANGFAEGSFLYYQPELNNAVTIWGMKASTDERVGASSSPVTAPTSFSGNMGGQYDVGDDSYLGLLRPDGRLTITKFDLAGRKASGTFSFTAPEQGGDRTVTVTNGKFLDIPIVMDE